MRLAGFPWGYPLGWAWECRPPVFRGPGGSHPRALRASTMRARCRPGQGFPFPGRAAPAPRGVLAGRGLVACGGPGNLVGRRRLVGRGRGGRIGRGLEVLLRGAGPRGRVDDGVGLGGDLAAEHGVDDGVQYVGKSFHVGRRYFLRVAMTTAVRESTPERPEMMMAASATSRPPRTPAIAR